MPNRTASEYFLVGQTGFWAAVALCALIRPQGLYANAGVSYYSGHGSTILPYAAGLLVAAWSTYKVAEWLTPGLRRWARFIAALTFGVAVIPFGFNSGLESTHNLLTEVLFVAELALVFWLALKVRRDFTNLALLLLAVAAAVLMVTYLNLVVGYLIFGELLFQAIFGVTIYRFLNNLPPPAKRGATITQK